MVILVRRFPMLVISRNIKDRHTRQADRHWERWKKEMRGRRERGGKKFSQQREKKKRKEKETTTHLNRNKSISKSEQNQNRSHWIGATKIQNLFCILKSYKCVTLRCIRTLMIVSKSTHEWPRVTTNDHEWARVTTSENTSKYCTDVIITSFYQIVTI